MKAPAYMTVCEVARQCGVTGETVRNWERNGKLRAFKTETGVRFFDRNDVRAHAAKRAREGK